MVGTVNSETRMCHTHRRSLRRVFSWISRENRPKAVPFSFGVATAVVMLYANLSGRWLMMTCSRWRDSVTWCYGWPFTARSVNQVLDAGSTVWRSVSDEVTALRIAVNAAIAMGMICGVTFASRILIQVFVMRQFSIADVLVLMLVCAGVLGYVKMEPSLCDFQEPGEWAVVPTFCFPGFVCWPLRVAIGCVILWGCVLVRRVAVR